MFLLVPSTFLAKYNIARIKLATNILISNALVIAFVFFVTNNEHLGFTICILKHSFNIPCPGCGVMTGLGELFQLNFHKAFNSNPCSLCIGLGMLISVSMAVLNSLSKRTLRQELLLKCVRIGNITLAFALLLNYIFTITRTFYLWL